MEYLNMILTKKEIHTDLNDYENNESYLNEIVDFIPKKDWEIKNSSIYFNVININRKSVSQGWKIHISAIPSNAVAILKIAAKICIDHNINFKFYLDVNVLELSSAKSFPRQSSGKFITIYPNNDEEFKYIIEQLYEELRFYSGPYILSDKRFRDCKILYYRYGGFISNRLLKHDGSFTEVISDPSGKLIEDSRNPYFTLPDWVKDPYDNESTNNENVGLKDGQYEIKNVIKFNNSGGIYLAYDNLNKIEVIIKEARPFTLTNKHDEYDAINYRKKESDIFKQLNSLSCTPKLLDEFYEWEHYFSVVEFIKGQPLREFLVENSPFVDQNVSKEIYQTFYSNLKKIWVNIINGITEIHEKNIFLCDFHINNFFIDEDLNIFFIDLDGALRQNLKDPFLYSPGYIAPQFKNEKIYTEEIEKYGLGALLFSTLSTFNQFLEIKPEFIDYYLNKLEIENYLPKYFSNIIKLLTSNKSLINLQIKDIPAYLNELNSTSMDFVLEYLDTKDLLKYGIDYILNTANPNNKFLFYTNSKIANPLNIENGSSGVLYALKIINKDIPKEYIDWVKSHKISNEAYPPSLYLGLSGIAWCMYELGEDTYSFKLMDLVNTHELKFSSPDIYTGTAGIGLANLFFWNKTKDEKYLNEAIECAEHLISIGIYHTNGTVSWPSLDGTTYIGYPKGASGIALFLLYLFSITKNTRYLEISKKAISFDLSFSLDKGNFISFPSKTSNSVSFSPYWLSGSAGVATTLLRYRFVTKDTTYDNVLFKIINDSNRTYSTLPSLFQGLAGLGNLMLDAEQFLNNPEYGLAAQKISQALNIFSINKDNGIAFPGDSLNYINNDFGTGSSGILLFLNRLITKENNFNFLIDDILFQ